jgi:hypothetical protein
MKEMTIPRFELHAAVLASRLGKSIEGECRLLFKKIIYFTDSRIVLPWICSQARGYKHVVSARVAEIQNNSDPSQWKHVLGEKNVADAVSRGVPVELNDQWNIVQRFFSPRKKCGRRKQQHSKKSLFE